MADERELVQLESGVRVVISAAVPMALMLSVASSDEICEASWPEFRRALKGAIDAERVRMGVGG